MYREHSAAASLVRHVECAWSVVTSEGLAGYAVAPDGCLDIIYSPSDGLRIVGAMTVEQRFNLSPGTEMVGVRFRPGMARSFFRGHSSEFTDVTAPLDAVWGRPARELASRLGDLRSAPEQLALLTASLPLPAPPDPVQQALEALRAAYGNLDLDWLADQANLSPRQFRRRCLETSGLTPKHLSRILRFQRICALAQKQPAAGWAGIAAEAGYFDQSHFIRDFREFTGRTPMSVFSNTDAVQTA